MNALFLVLAFGAQDLPARESDAKRNSKNGTLSTDFDGVKTTVTYGRPHVKGRTVWGDLVKYDEVWRAGSDEATVVAFEKDVKVEGQKLAAGVYSFFAIPGKEEWTVIFNKEAKQWGAYKYDSKKDAVRVKVKAKPAESTDELTFEKSGDALQLRWDKVAVPVRISGK